MTIACDCFNTPVPVGKAGEKFGVDCMVCKKPLIYLEQEIEKECHYCSKKMFVNALCEDGHFVCDNCHSKDGREIIEKACFNIKETDLITLFTTIRDHPSIAIHGPDHHSLIPAVVLTAYRNSGGDVSLEDIVASIRRGATIAGGACAYMGVCGAATGIGIAFSIILKANPYKGDVRQIVQKVNLKAMEMISDYAAGRCCQRDGWLALRVAAELSKEYLDIELKADGELICSQFTENKECIQKECPLWPANLKKKND